MSHPEFSIGKRKIGYNHPPLVIAEIGINHEGDLDTAVTMVDAAKTAGAEIIKHQTHIIADEMSKAAKHIVPGNADISIYDIMDRCALSESEEIKLKNYIEQQGMIFISTPFSRSAANRLERMGVQAYKIGSGECNNYPLVNHIASFGKPIILSTGMNTIDSIKQSVDIFRRHNVPYALLHCTNVYPTPPELVRLGAINEIQEAFPDAVVGLSDHTTSNFACLGSMALGASIVERHFTDHPKRPGPDIPCSMTPAELTELITGSSILQKARGGSKHAVKEEKVTSDFAFSSVVTTKEISKGECFTKDNIWVKRPGTGYFSADRYEELLGLTATSYIKDDSQLNIDNIKELSE